ncbi:MAG: signal recognition particle protein [Phycisphaerales bacterium]|nr:signal recognition particle protein [Phycisphaerales bacterium]
MFERLSEGFSSVFRKLSGQGKISEANVREAMGEVRSALLEADVNLGVVDRFCARVLEDALGREVTKSVSPGQEMIAIVHAALVDFLGGPAGEGSGGVMRVSPGPTVVMMCGLQGSGKTTTCGKLAAYLKKRGRSVMLAAADLQRPAAVEQLETIARQVQHEAPGGAQVHFHGEPDKCAAYGQAVGVAVEVCRRAYKEAQRLGVDTLILDTAGRLHVNDQLMGELQQVKRAVPPHQVFLVIDAMTGQDAVNSAKAFHERLEVDGLILTKFDSDTRGGAALSAKQVTGAPIAFIGVGEKIDAIEEFHAERMAGRILGMGDVVSLVEKAQQEVSEEEAKRLEAKMAKGELTMDDFLGQLKSLRRMGPLKQLMGLLPGVGAALKDVHVDDKQLDQVEAVIRSMTPRERSRPELIDLSRRKRISRGSGTKEQDVGQFVKQFMGVSKMMKQMSQGTIAQRVRAVKEMGAGGMGGMLPGVDGLPNFGKAGAGAGPKRFKSRPKKR